MSRQDATDLLMGEREGGVFLVRDSATIQVRLLTMVMVRTMVMVTTMVKVTMMVMVTMMLMDVSCHNDGDLNNPDDS